MIRMISFTAAFAIVSLVLHPLFQAATQVVG